MRRCRECGKNKKDVKYRGDYLTYDMPAERLLCEKCDKKIHCED